MSSVITTETFLAMTPILRNEMVQRNTTSPRKDSCYKTFSLRAKRTQRMRLHGRSVNTGIREESNSVRHGRPGHGRAIASKKQARMLGGAPELAANGTQCLTGDLPSPRARKSSASHEVFSQVLASGRPQGG